MNAMTIRLADKVLPSIILAVAAVLSLTRASLMAGPSPTITIEPTNQTVVVGSAAMFSVTASGTGPLTYQWQLDGTNLPGDLITTAAGYGSRGYSGDGGSAGKALLNSPQSVVLDTNHNLFIADTGNHRIRKLDTNGIISTVAGIGTNGYSGDGGLAVAAGLNSPGGVGFDLAGNLVIADTGNCRIRRIGPDGNISTLAGNGTNGFGGDGGPAIAASLNSPSGTCFDSAGNLYIADTQNHRVRRVGLDGSITTVAGNGSSSLPETGDGGAATNTIVRYPISVVMDASGNLLIAEAGGSRVRKVDASGTVSTWVGTGNQDYSGDGGAATNAGVDPYCIAMDSAGDLFIADEYNNRIRMVDTNRTITTVAGNGSWVYSGDNMAATNAALNSPLGVAVDGTGNLFIADTYDHRIREVEVTSYPALILNGVTANLAGEYQVIVSNAFGSVTGRLATLTVLLPPSIASQPVNQYALLGGTAAFAATTAGDAPLNYRWFFNGLPLSDNGRFSGTETNQLAIQNIQAADAGAYQLVVTNASGAITSSVASLVIATARYVNAGNPSPSAPYASWATAATVIQNAIDAANVGDWIFVTNGTYNTGGRIVGVNAQKWNRVVMTNQVTLLSVNGPLATTILGEVAPDVHLYGTRCVWLGSGAKLSGFTVASGGNYYQQYSQNEDDVNGGGIYGESPGAVVADCIIMGNAGCWYGGGADNCTLNNCLLAGNNAWQSGQGGDGGGAYDCTLVNCTVVGNTAALGGGVGACTVQNSIVYSNSATTFGDPNNFASSFLNSCTAPDPGGVGNTTNDPVFVDYAGGDYRLQFNSPCINSGSTTFVATSNDLDGHPRMANSLVDMGAYEYQHAPWFLASLTSRLQRSASRCGYTFGIQMAFR